MDLTAPHFTDPDKAREYLEKIRWPGGPICPHCGGTERCVRLQGKSTRPGVIKCGDCRKQFTVTVGTVFERSKIPLHKWLMATALLCASKKGISSHQLHRTIGVTYKTAWFMTHRIREAMREGRIIQGGGGGVVEADETYIGGKEKHNKKLRREKRRISEGPLQGQRKRGRSVEKEKVVTLVERGGKAQSFHVAKVNAATLRPILLDQLHYRTRLMTDEANVYKRIGFRLESHESVNHKAEEYVRGDVHTNTVEGYFAILKRGIYGVYHHVSAEHLKRYLGEFDFRYNHRGVSDAERTDAALNGIEGKRLTYYQARS